MGNCRDMVTSKIRIDDEVQGDRLTRCFDDIMKFAAEMMVQQQLKTIQLSSDVTPGFRKSLSKSLGEKVRSFHSILDGIESTLTTTKGYLNAVDEEVLKMKKWKQQQEEEIRRNQLEGLEKNKKLEKPRAVAELSYSEQQQIMQQTQGDLTMLMPSGLIPELETGISQDQETNNRRATEKHFNPEFGDLNEMDISMFGGIDGQGESFLEDFNMGVFNSIVNNNKNGISGSFGDANGGNRSHDRNMHNTDSTISSAQKPIETIEGKGKLSKNNIGFSTSTSNVNTTNGQNIAEQDPKQTAQQGSMNSDDYLTLNDFNDLGIGWNTTGYNNELDFNDFNM